MARPALVPAVPSPTLGIQWPEDSRRREEEGQVAGGEGRAGQTSGGEEEGHVAGGEGRAGQVEVEAKHGGSSRSRR